jgi:hypothetical protein
VSCSIFASPGSHDKECVPRMSLPLEMSFIATVVFGDFILWFEEPVRDSLTSSTTVAVDCHRTPPHTRHCRHRACLHPNLLVQLAIHKKKILCSSVINQCVLNSDLLSYMKTSEFENIVIKKTCPTFKNVSG